MSPDPRRDAVDQWYERLVDAQRAELGLPPREPAPPWPSFTCPRCGLTSHNPNDAREGYCGACHDWTARPGDELARAVGRRDSDVPGEGGPRPAPGDRSPPVLGEVAGGDRRRAQRRAALQFVAAFLIGAGAGLLVAGCALLWRTAPAAVLVLAWTAVVLVVLAPLRRLWRRGRR